MRFSKNKSFIGQENEKKIIFCDAKKNDRSNDRKGFQKSKPVENPRIFQSVMTEAKKVDDRPNPGKKIKKFLVKF